MTINDRINMELNNKPYYPPEQMAQFISENELNPNDEYDRTLHERQMLCTILDILESLCNNINIYHSIETEFATTGAAYQNLERRIQRLQQRIDALRFNNDKDYASDVSYLFFH